MQVVGVSDGDELIVDCSLQARDREITIKRLSTPTAYRSGANTSHTLT